MDGLQIGKFIVICIDTGAKEKSGISTIDNLRSVAKLNKIRLMLLVSRRNQAMDLFKLVFGISNR
jgi:hypothetical protein